MVHEKACSGSFLSLETNTNQKERIKVMMQAQQNSLYANELECIQAVLETEG